MKSMLIWIGHSMPSKQRPDDLPPTARPIAGPPTADQKETRPLPPRWNGTHHKPSRLQTLQP